MGSAVAARDVSTRRNRNDVIPRC